MFVCGSSLPTMLAHSRMWSPRYSIMLMMAHVSASDGVCGQAGA